MQPPSLLADCLVRSGFLFWHNQHRTVNARQNLQGEASCPYKIVRSRPSLCNGDELVPTVAETFRRLAICRAMVSAATGPWPSSQTNRRAGGCSRMCQPFRLTQGSRLDGNVSAGRIVSTSKSCSPRGRRGESWRVSGKRGRRNRIRRRAAEKLSSIIAPRPIEGRSVAGFSAVRATCSGLKSSCTDAPSLWGTVGGIGKQSEPNRAIPPDLRAGATGRASEPAPGPSFYESSSRTQYSRRHSCAEISNSFEIRIQPFVSVVPSQ